MGDGNSIDVHAIDEWMETWVYQSASWHRVWSSDREERLEFSQSFIEVPSTTRVNGNSVKIRFIGIGHSQVWRAWLGRIVNDPVDSSLGFRKLESCRDLKLG